MYRLIRPHGVKERALHCPRLAVVFPRVQIKRRLNLAVTRDGG